MLPLVGTEAYAQNIASTLISSFLEVEELFTGDREETEQEVIDSLRQVCLRGM